MVKYFTPQVTKMANGNFQFSIRYRDVAFEGVRKKSIVIKKNTAFARNNAEVIVKKKINDSLGKIGQSKITFSELSRKYLTSLEKRGVAFHTVRSYRSEVKQLNKKFGQQVISTINTVSINRYLDDLLYTEDLSNRTVSLYRTMLNQIFKYAKQFGYVENNPVAEVKVNFKDDSRKRQFRTENWYLSDSEFKKIIDGLEEKNRLDYRDLVLWLYLTGMRVGEGCAIQVKDVFKQDDIYFAKVHGTLIAKIGGGFEKQPFTKTKSSSRDVALPKQAIDIYFSNAKGKKPDDFLLTNKRSGNPFNTLSINLTLQNICKSKKIDKQITSHILRHTHVSKLSELGYPLDIISKRVGHENDDITRKIYLHITNKKAKKFNEMIKDFKF